ERHQPDRAAAANLDAALDRAVGKDAAHALGAFETGVAEHLARDEALRLFRPELTGLSRQCANDPSNDQQTTRKHDGPTPKMRRSMARSLPWRSKRIMLEFHRQILNK